VSPDAARCNHLFELGILSNYLRSAAAGREFFLEEQVLRHQPSLRERPLDHQQQMIGVDRLGQEVERAFPHGHHRILNAAKRRHHDDGQLGIGFHRRAEHTESVTFRKTQIGQDDARARGAKRLDRFPLIARFDDGVALRLERVAQHGAKRVFVLDKQNGRIGGAARHVGVEGSLTEPAGRDSGAPGLFLQIVDGFPIGLDVFLQPIEFCECFSAIGLDDFTLRRIVPVHKVGTESIDPALKRIDIRLAACQRGLELLQSASPVLLAFRRIVGRRCRPSRRRRRDILWSRVGSRHRSPLRRR
jgi:hypothetical protein